MPTFRGNDGKYSCLRLLDISKLPSPDKIREKLERRKAQAKAGAKENKKDTDKRVYVGIPSDAPDYPDGTDVVMVATVHEYGSEAINIPPKRFLRGTIENNRDEYVNMLKQYGLLIANRKISLERALGLVGTKVSSDVQMTISTEKFERWAYTKKDGKRIPKKNSDGKRYRESGHLIDTGHLRRSITYKVK